MKISTLNILLLFLFPALASSCFAQNKITAPRVFSKDRNALAINRKKLKSGDENLMPSYRELLKNADALLGIPCPSVMEKKQTPPSGDMHDYMSLAIYFWPDPSKADGLPYIRKDGEINPEVKEYKDKENMMKVSEYIETLSLAYYFSDDVKYSKKAEEFIRTWFLNPETRMNPNLNFAQAVKGKNDGRGIGIIESRILNSVVDGVGMLQSSPTWTKNDQERIEKWFEDFLQWLVTSKNGIEESQSKNNHGIWYDEQKFFMALFANKTEIASSALNSLKKRMEQQMDTAGFFPLELDRTISLHYSAFVLEPLFLASNMADAAGLDLWSYEPSSGKSLKKAFMALQPYLSKDKDWFAQQIKPFEFEDNSTPLLAYGYYKYDCKTCKEAIIKILGSEKARKSIYHLTTLID